MQIEEGAVLSGKVTGFTKFGAFVELDNENTGMVHISEVANTYVEDIKDHLTLNQEVQVKVLSVSGGKISLSIKKLLPPEPRRPKPATQPKSATPRPRGQVWQGSKTVQPPEGKATFEDMMSKFKKDSDEKMSALKRASDVKRGSGGGGSRRGK